MVKWCCVAVLDQFPFDNGQGLFETVLSIEQGELQYNPDWPRAKRY